MPTKQGLLDVFDNSKDMLNHAVDTLGVHSQLKSIKKTSGSVQVTACLASDHSEVFQGTGANNREALADCISAKFPF